jgi:hypothetical protein
VTNRKLPSRDMTPRNSRINAKSGVASSRGDWSRSEPNEKHDAQQSSTILAERADHPLDTRVSSEKGQVSASRGEVCHLIHRHHELSRWRTRNLFEALELDGSGRMQNPLEVAVDFRLVFAGKRAVADVSDDEAADPTLNDLILLDPFSFKKRLKQWPRGKAPSIGIGEEVDLATGDRADSGQGSPTSARSLRCDRVVTDLVAYQRHQAIVQRRDEHSA